MMFLSLLLACGTEKSPAEEGSTETQIEAQETTETGLETMTEEETVAEEETATDTGEEETETSTDTTDTEVSEECMEVPLITYSSFGEGFITFNCQGCHGSAAFDRQGAPDAVTFDNHEETLNWLSRIYARTYTSQNMPPALGIFEDDLERLRIWIDCWGGI